jgi:hypothetical protein
MGPGPSESHSLGQRETRVQNGVVWYDEREDCYEQESYLGRDPTGPLAPLGGPEPLLQHGSKGKKLSTICAALHNSVLFFPML